MRGRGRGFFMSLRRGGGIKLMVWVVLSVGREREGRIWGRRVPRLEEERSGVELETAHDDVSMARLHHLSII